MVRGSSPPPPFPTSNPRLIEREGRQHREAPPRHRRRAVTTATSPPLRHVANALDLEPLRLVHDSAAVILYDAGNSWRPPHRPSQLVAVTASTTPTDFHFHEVMEIGKVFPL